MKIALFLTMVCAVALLNGCSTNQGGTSDEHNMSYETYPGSGYETEPSVTEPSLPQDPNLGPQTPLPDQNMGPNTGPQIPPP